MGESQLNKSIEIMKNRIVNILSNNCPSIYLYGSIVLEDFRLGWSDIDILCLTQTQISGEQAEALLNLRQKLMKQNRDNLYFRSFEGGILSINAFIHDVEGTVVYWGTGGERITDKYNFDPFSTIELIEAGRLLHGEEVRDKFKHPSKKEIAEAVRKHYSTIRKYSAATGKSLYSAGWLLDIARCIYTLRTGKIISKTEAGQWAVDNKLIRDTEIMKKVIEIRKQPIKYKNNTDILEWLGTLDEYIQRFADVLEKELSIASL